ncbi:MAG: hypothetical protein HQK77_22105 [Desulfobacterales bacterium]|nr:hypothetical protein [Desulfobacterales bacterium]
MKAKNGINYDQNYDFIVKWMSELLCGETLDVIGLNTGKIVEVFTFEPVDIAVTSGRVDIMIRNDQGALFHIEEQRDLCKDDLYRFAAYHFMGAKKYKDKLTDVIIASGDVFNGEAGKKEVRTPSGTYTPIVIDLSERNGFAVLNRIREEIRSDNLSSLMELVFVPLYGKQTRLQRSQLAEEVILLEKDLYTQGRLSVRLLAATFIMANKMIDKNRLNDLWEEIQMIDIIEFAKTKGLQEGIVQGLEQGLVKGLEKGRKEGLLEGLEKGIEKGIEKGLEKGLTKGIRDMLLDALIESFGVLPTHVSEKINAISQTDTLRSLFRVALKSKSLEQFSGMLNQVTLH